jgi:hypothetical protein
MELWHHAKASEFHGDALVPCCLRFPEVARLARVSFFDTREAAEHWNRSRFYGSTLFRTDSANVPDLRPHEFSAGAYFTTQSVPLHLLEVVTRRPGPSFPGVLELVRGASE